MHIHLFGSCQITWQGQPWNLPRRQLRALLFRLAARLEPVSRAHLAFLFWPDQPDAVARRHLTRLISSLRAALPLPNLLLIAEETVALNPLLCASDSDTFWRLSADNAQLAPAVALYRSPFMGGFSLSAAPEFDAWQEQMARQLQQRCLSALATLVHQATAVANHAAIITYARQSLAIDELDESMHRHLIAAHTAVGDRAAALRQFEECALILERELGVSPLAETRAALRPPKPLDSRPILPVWPTLDLPFIGRKTALAQALSTLKRFTPGGCLFITGEPGVGKSRLLRECIARWTGPLLVTNSAPDGRSLPYQPLIHALRAALPDAATWTIVPPLWRSELLPLLPELRAMFPDLPAPPGTTPALAQQRLFTALAQTCRALAGQGTLLLALDDLHWADADTLGWFRFLTVNWDDLPLVMMVTAVASTPELALLRQALARTGRLTEVSLAGLPVTAVADLLRCLPAPASPELAARIWEVTAGNPFFVLEILRELQESDQLAHPPATLPLPQTVREVIETRLAHLTPTTRQVLEAAAVLHLHLDEALLRHTSARSESEIADALDELLAHKLIEITNSLAPNADRPSSIAISHALLQTAVYQSLSPWRQKLLHHRAAEALIAHRPEQAVVIAHHFTMAGESATAVAHLQRAATQSRERFAHETALSLVNQAITLLPAIPQSEQLHLSLLRQRLALNRLLVRIPQWQADATDLLHRATTNTSLRLEALEAQISLYVLQSDFARVEETSKQALALAIHTSDRQAEARIRQTYGWHLADALGRSREGLAQLQMACRLAQEMGDTAVQYQALCHLAFVQRAEGQCASARASAEAALALTPYQPGHPPHPAFADALRELGEANAYLGRWEEARQQLRPLLDLYQTFNDPWAYGSVLYNYGLYSSNMGQHEEAIAALRQLVTLSESVGLPADSDYGIWHRAGLARALLAAGQVQKAGNLLRSLQTARLLPGRPYLAWAKAAAEYYLAQGQGAEAQAVLHPAAAWWRQNASLHDADILLLLAQAEMAVGETRKAETAVTEAATCLQPTDMHRYHLRLHATHWHITHNPADLIAFQAELERQVASFTDLALRKTFWQHIQRHYQMPNP